MAISSVIHDRQDLGLLLGQPRRRLGLDQMGDGAVKALVGGQLDVAAVVEDPHAGGFQLLSQPAQAQPHF